MDNFVKNKSNDKKPKLLDQVRQVIRINHYSMRTEESYISWIKRFIFYHMQLRGNILMQNMNGDGSMFFLQRKYQLILDQVFKEGITCMIL